MVPILASRWFRPRIHCGVARQESNLTIIRSPLQVRPIRRLADLRPTCDHHPGLPVVVGSEPELELEIRAGHQLRDRHTRLIVILLPTVKTLSVAIISTGAAGARPCRRLWLVPEPAWHSCHVMPRCHVVLAHWLGHPPMACCPGDNKSQDHQF